MSPPVVAGNFAKYTIFAVLNFYVHSVQSNSQHVSPASGPRWNFHPQTPLLPPPLSKFLATPLNTARGLDRGATSTPVRRIEHDCLSNL